MRRLASLISILEYSKVAAPGSFRTGMAITAAASFFLGDSQRRLSADLAKAAKNLSDHITD